MTRTRVVGTDVELGGAVDVVAEVTSLRVVLEREVALRGHPDVDLLEADDLGLPRKLLAVLLEQFLEITDREILERLEVLSHLTQTLPDLDHLLCGLVDVVEGDATDRNPQKRGDIFIGDVALYDSLVGFKPSTTALFTSSAVSCSSMSL